MSGARSALTIASDADARGSCHLQPVQPVQSLVHSRVPTTFWGAPGPGGNLLLLITPAAVWVPPLAGQPACWECALVSAQPFPAQDAGDPLPTYKLAGLLANSPLMPGDSRLCLALESLLLLTL
jgi:hypothetical protein